MLTKLLFPFCYFEGFLHCTHFLVVLFLVFAHFAIFGVSQVKMVLPQIRHGLLIKLCALLLLVLHIAVMCLGLVHAGFGLCAEDVIRSAELHPSLLRVDID